MASKRHEAIGFLLLSCALARFACLVSYSPFDASVDSLFRNPAHNWIGRVGAQISAHLFRWLGRSAFLLLFPLIIIGWKLLRGREIESAFVRALGLVLLISASSAVFEFLPRFVSPDTNFTQGGIVGNLLKDVLLENLNLTGTAILV